jgi:pullulanase/glycogen debranching enzyme
MEAHAADLEVRAILTTGVVPLFHDRDDEGNQRQDDDILVLLNAWHEQVDFHLPGDKKKTDWEPLVDTRHPRGEVEQRKIAGGEIYHLEPRSAAVFSRQSKK